MTNFPEKIASALMDSIMAAFRTEAADLRRLAEEVDAAGQDVEKIRATIERYANTRTQAMETIRTTLTAEVEEFKRQLGIR
jgi:predicted solute-binding protein